MAFSIARLKKIIEQPITKPDPGDSFWHHTIYYQQILIRQLAKELLKLNRPPKV